MKEWHVSRHGAKLEGQYSVEEVRQMAGFPGNLFVWREGMTEWRNPGALPDFAETGTGAAPQGGDGRISPSSPGNALRRTLTWCIAIPVLVLGVLPLIYLVIRFLESPQDGATPGTQVPSLPSATPTPPAAVSVSTNAPASTPAAVRDPYAHIPDHIRIQDHRLIAPGNERPPPPLPPVITELIPRAILPGQMVTIRGNGFSTNLAENRILVGGALPSHPGALRPVYADERELRAPLDDTYAPVNDAGGGVKEVRVYVTHRGMSNPLSLVLMRPAFFRCTPTNAAPGQQFTICVDGQYTHFREGETRVVSEDPFLEIKSCRVESPTRIHVEAAARSTSSLGWKGLSVQTGGEKIRFSLYVAVEENPSLERAEYAGSNTAGGTEVELWRLHGSRFVPNYRDTAVFCGGRRCVIRHITTDTIEFLLPPGFTAGETKVRVGQQESNTLPIEARIRSRTEQSP